MNLCHLTMKDGSLLTHHEIEAMVLFATKCHKDVVLWEPVRSIERGFWYDFADPATGTIGQCRMDYDWTWQQAPRGTEPVILRLVGDPQ